MSDTEGSGGPGEARNGLWRRIRSRFGRVRDVGLRESLTGAIETHEAQNPGEMTCESFM